MSVYVPMAAGVSRTFVAPPVTVMAGIVEPAALPVTVLFPLAMERLEIARTVVESIQMSESLTETVLSAAVRNGAPAWKYAAQRYVASPPPESVNEPA